MELALPKLTFNSRIRNTGSHAALKEQGGELAKEHSLCNLRACPPAGLAESVHFPEILSLSAQQPLAALSSAA
jgi:hypothetical protein